MANYPLPPDNQTQCPQQTIHSDTFPQPTLLTHTPPETSDTNQDNNYWSNPLQQKSRNNILLYFQNIHGLSTQHIWTDWHSLIHNMNLNEIDIFGFAETNIPCTPTTRHIAKQQMKTHLNHSQISLTAAACNEPTLGWKQPGGVCQGAVGPLVGGIDSTNNDSMGLGRWTYMTITCKHNCKLHIITAYCVSQSSLPNGDNTAYSQQYCTMRRMGYEKSQPRIQFIQDLIDLVKTLNSTGEVIVMLDSNAPIHETHMMNLLSQTGLYNTMEYLHNQPTPRTYLQGQNTIDHILATCNVLPAIQQAGMLAFNDGIQSDHRGLWIDLQLESLELGTTTINLHSTLIPSTKHHKQCKYLKEEFTKHYNDLSIRQKLDTLTQTYSTMPLEEATATLNNIDELVDVAMLKPLQTAPKQYTPWWSLDIQNGHLILQYWKLCGTEQALDITFTAQKQAIRDKLPPDANLYQDTPGATIQKQIRVARTNLAHLLRNSFELRQ